MSGNNAEFEELRAVSCSALLERLPPPWQLDKAESQITMRKVNGWQTLGEKLTTPGPVDLAA